MPQGLQFMPMTAAQHLQYFGATPPVPANTPQSNSNGFVAQGGMPGMVSKMTGQSRQQIIPAGQAYTTNQGSIRSAPAESQVNTAQHELVTIKQMKPLFQAIAKQAPHFLGSGEMAKVRGEQFLGWLHQNVPGDTNLSYELEPHLGMSPQDLSNYNNFQTNLKTLAHQYMNAHGWSPTEENTAAALKAVSPGVGEGPTYVNRMSNLFNYLNKGIGNVNRNLLSGGFSTTPVQAETNYVPPSPATSASQEVNHGIWNNSQLTAIDKSSLSASQRTDLALGKMVTDKEGNTWVYMNGQLGMKPSGK